MSADHRPNIVVFMPDQLRADCVGTFGKSMVRTPNFDRLAAMGAATENCIVQHPVCTPSRCAIMTGWYPHVRGHRTLNYLLRGEDPNLLRYLRQAGYWVEWHGKNDLLTDESFEDSVDHRGRTQGDGRTFIDNPWPEDHPLRHSFYYGERPRDLRRDHDWMCVQNAMEFLKNPPAGQPFFLYLPLIYPHPPYNIEEPYFSMYPRDRVPAPARCDYSQRPAFMQMYHRLHGMDRVDEAWQREIIATYYGMVTRTDHLFGKVLDTLEQQGLLDNTAVFVLSDHGDFTCDYGLVEKWWTGLTDNLTRVPFYMYIPGMEARGPVNALMESIDLFPTVMELAGVTGYHRQFGRSLLPLAAGQTHRHREYAFCESGHHPRDLHCREELVQGIYYPKTKLQHIDFKYNHKAVMVRSEKWKYIRHLTDIPELYDLEADPREETNLAGRQQYGPVIAQMDGQLLRWYMETCDYVPPDLDRRDIRGW